MKGSQGAPRFVDGPRRWFDRLDARCEGRGAQGLILLVVLAVAAALRIVFYRQLAETAGFVRPLVDSSDYLARARGVLAGTWPDGVFFLDPLYPYFLAGHFSVFGNEVAGIFVLQMIVGVLTVGLLYGFAASFLGPTDSLLVGLLAATYPVTMFFEGLVLKAALAVFFVTAVMFALARARNGLVPSIVAGLLTGLGGLLRGNLLLLAPVGCLWLLWTARDQRGWQRVLRPLIFGTTVLVALLPVTLHNLGAGDFVLTTSNLGANLYVGNGVHNDTGTYRPPPGVRGSPVFEREDFRRRAEEARGTSLSPSGVSRYWVERTLEDARADPEHLASLWGRKLALAVNSVEVPDNASFARTRDEVPLLQAPLPCFGVLLILAAAGIVLVRWKPEHLLLVGCGAALAATLVVFFVNARFRLVLVPPLVVLAGACPGAVVTALSERRWVRLGLALLLASIALFVTTRDVYESSPTMLEFNDATLAYESGDWEAADEALERALEGDARNWRAWVLRGLVRAAEERSSEAEAAFERALELAPRQAEAWAELGFFLVEEARLVDARRSLEQALKLGSVDAKVILTLAEVERRERNFASARSRVEEHLENVPLDATAWHLLGVIELDSGDPVAAEGALLRATAERPENVLFRLSLARSLRRQGRRDEARDIYTQVLAERPGDPRATQALRSLDR